MSFLQIVSRNRIVLYSSFLTLISYLSVLVSPEAFWPASFLSQLIPLLLVFQAIALIVLILRKNKIAFIPLLTLLIGWPFLHSTFAFNSALPANNSIQVLSFNAKFFRESRTYSKFSTELIEWVANDSSDIKCVQEYSTNDRWAPLDVTGQLRAKGYTDFIFQANVVDREHNPGLAIFSKYVMFDSGIVFEAVGTPNAAIFADININGKMLRVYNVHLASMNLDLYETKGFAKILFILKRLKYGAVKRNQQIKELIKHTQSSPYPYIICGDFNETPYTYNYNQLNKAYQNTFEERGRGLGFTFNEIPYLLRIDHQFYSEGVKALNYYVNKTMNISDHFPTYGYYLIK
jgi:endonuclease/exonuclease/phosphatase family metal-dependent hydrolase